MEAELKGELSKGLISSEIIECLRCSLEAKEHQIKLLEEKIHYLLHCRFSSKSEHSDERQASLFANNDTNIEIEDASTEIEVPAHTRNKGGRRIPPKELPHVRIEHDLPEDEKLCTCGHHPAY